MNAADSNRRLESLSGQHDLKVDNQGRVSIPATFRSQRDINDGDELIIARHLREHSLLVFDAAAWAAFTARIADDPTSTGNALRRVTRASARHMKVDRLGRVSLPAALRSHADIEVGQPAYCVGQGEWMEIWDAGVWNRTHAPEVYAEHDLSAYGM